ncbi:hypothetical protein M9Y10_035167 [Tritrichomonas musculus]|uniref:Sec16 Sec23-binding domain-containing protein n=1 Tax=Tritrichomonas musculus TaxID=1915356 RepID=A0ABR2KI05_9EUKA
MKVWSVESPSIVEWCPIRNDSRLYASSTPSTCEENPSLTLSRFNFLGITPTTETVATFNAKSPFTTLSWTNHPSQNLGLLASGHKDGSISLYSPAEKSTISSLSYHKTDITCLKFNPTQTNVLLSVSSDNEISVWDVTHPENGKRCSAGAINRAVQGTITSVDWHKKSTLSSFFALCDSTGLCVVWDLRQNRSTHNFADSTFKSELSDISFAPVNSTLLATASSNPRNSVVSIWDLRNPTTPTRKLHGHTSGVSKLEWPACDERILLSSGKDGNVIAWNTESGEQLKTVFESNSPVSQLSWSPHFHGAVLASNLTGTQLYSFVDPAMGVSNKLPHPHFHRRQCGVDVAFDGRIFQFNGKNVHSFVHQEQIAEASDFVHFVEALEQNTMPLFVNEKIENSDNNTEKELWEICLLAMSPDTFKQNILTNLGISQQSNFAEQLKQAEPQPSLEESGATASSASLFGDPTPTDEVDAAFAFSKPSALNDNLNMISSSNPNFAQEQAVEEEVFTEVFTPFRVIPKKEKDEAGNIIASALITGDLKAAIDCCFQSEKYADALLIASCGSPELLQKTRERYIRQDNTALTRLISFISQDRLDNFVRYAKTKEWKEAFAVICNFAKTDEDFERLSEVLGRRLIAEKNDYSSAYICFVAAKKYDMVQQCLFQIYQTVENKDSSSASVVLLVLEKLCAMAGTKADSVIAPIARTFLQHVIQSGNKDQAIRFVNALPPTSQLQNLKAVLGGQPVRNQGFNQSNQTANQSQMYQRSTSAIPNQAQAPNQPFTPANVFTPSQGPGLYPGSSNRVPPPPAQANRVPSGNTQPPKATQQPNQPQVFVPISGVVPPTTAAGYGNTPYIPSSQGFKPKQQQIAPPPPGPAPSAQPQFVAPGPVQQPNVLAPPPMQQPQIQPPQIDQGFSMPNQPPPISTNYNIPGATPYGLQPQPPAAAKPAAPPPMATPNINVPPPAPAVILPPTPQIQQPPIQQPGMVQMPGSVQPPNAPGIPGVQVTQPTRIEAPPMAQPNINAPPPMTVVPPPMPTQFQPQPSNQMNSNMPNAQYAQPGMGQFNQMQQPVTVGVAAGAPPGLSPKSSSPAPAPEPSPEATIEDVPQQNRQLADQLVSLINELETRPNLKPAQKKALTDAQAKLPFVFGLLRDGKVPEGLINDMILFIQKINGGELSEANQIRKNAIVNHMANCRDAVLIMNYISSSIR